MNAFAMQGRQVLLGAVITGMTLFTLVTTTAESTNEIGFLQIQGELRISPPGATDWVPTTSTNQTLKPFYRLRTGPNGRVALLWSDGEVVRFGPLTEIEILPPQAATEQSGLHLLKGIMSFFHRDKPGRIRIITRGAFAGIKGTEFVVAVEPPESGGRTTFWVLDGMVSLTNEATSLVLTNGQAAVVEPGRPAVPLAGFVVNHVLQWAFYYPAVLDLEELPLATEERAALAESLAAYDQGDLLGALAKYPAQRQPATDAERVYKAALLLAVGHAAQAQSALEPLSKAEPPDRISRLAGALLQLVAAVRREAKPASAKPGLATELLAASYYQQSLGLGEQSLQSALVLAKQAADRSPQFGFAWARLAELQFSFGRTEEALVALNNALVLAPRDAEALALQGFLLAAQNRTRDALTWFDHAIATDEGLANAWLGRGLCRIRSGDSHAGREDLLVAAALEPQRAALRSYLGKAFEQTGEFGRARKELERAKELDPNDPTSWLYAALLEQRENRINEGIRDLERSEDLNDNRNVYRSRLMLDQDRAVRSANLAAVYRDAGMFDVSVREAARAVSYDYANYSAHLFLANSYNELRDPNLINLRYETPSEAEYLVANLLAPVGAGTLSPTLSQQEYSKLFERDRFGVTSDTEYLSRGAWTENGAQYGTLDNLSYSLDAFYRTDPGQRLNDDVEQRQLALALKQQLTPQDSVFLEALQYEASGGDLAQYYDPAQANPGFRFHEREQPIIAAGYHRQWSPGVDTLFLAARLDDTLSLNNPAGPTLLYFVPFGSLTAVRGLNMVQDFTGSVEIWSTELQQIWQQGQHTTILGARFQWGDFRTQNLQTQPSELPGQFAVPAADQDFTTAFQRATVYAYHYWLLPADLQLIAGLTYDHLTYPRNFRFAPISPDQETTDKLSPKAGLIWRPALNTTVRFAYTRALSGASLDQSFQLEPSQIAGFIQSYRSIIPESVSGPNAGAQFETFGLSLEQKLGTGTYLGLLGQILNSKVERTVGAFRYHLVPPATPSGLEEDLDYHEPSLVATVNQLIGNRWSFGLRYQVTRSELTDEFPQTTSGLFFSSFAPYSKTTSTLHQADLLAVYNHPCGGFAQFDALWYWQSNDSDSGSLPGDNFWQLNALAGYRLHNRQAELTVGVLNLTDQDYRLNPLTPYNDLPRGRTAVVRLGLRF
jgi:Tfp pilus assembly protein PilF/outer membrane receptor protein involved in Fe transport